MSLKKEMVALAQQQNNYVYIVRCRDQTLYTGWTNQLEKRIEAHNAGKGAKYTKARRPVELVYFETFEHKSEALKREYQIKQLKRSEIENMLYTKASITIPLTSCPIKLNKVRITGDILGTIIFKIKILKTPMIPPKYIIKFVLSKEIFIC